MEIIQLVKQEVSKVAPDNEVILFGSRASGYYRADSDWDFLILIEDDVLTKEKKERIQDLLYDVELRTGEVISTLIHIRSDWEKRAVTPIYQIIEKEGQRA